eukprot:5812245-Pyramimonas_sp.AAC.1
MQKYGPQVKNTIPRGETCPTCYLRPSNAHSSPDIKCPESLHSRVPDLIEAGSPRYFIHGTQWRHIPSILNVGMSCRSEDRPKWDSGRHVVHGCP